MAEIGHRPIDLTLLATENMVSCPNLRSRTLPILSIDHFMMLKRWWSTIFSTCTTLIKTRFLLAMIMSGMFLAIFYKFLRINIQSDGMASPEFLVLGCRQKYICWLCDLHSSANLSINEKPFVEIQMGVLADTYLGYLGPCRSTHWGHRRYTVPNIHIYGYHLSMSGV